MYKTGHDSFYIILEGRKTIFSEPDKKFNLLPSQNSIALAVFDYMKRL